MQTLHFSFGWYSNALKGNGAMDSRILDMEATVRFAIVTHVCGVYCVYSAIYRSTYRIAGI